MSSPSPAWRLLTLSTALCAYLYVLMEWLFFATKPSFLSGLSWAGRAGVFLEAGLLLAAAATLPLLALWLADRLVHREGFTRIAARIGLAVPALVLSLLTLILVDNFTYTVFRFGVVSTRGAGRLGYGALLLAAFAVCCRKVATFLAQRMPGPNPIRRLEKTALAALAIPGLLLLAGNALVAAPAGLQQRYVSGLGGALPNIILIGADGLEATRMSAFGYRRETTPNIRRLMQTALVAENAFSNAGNTGGSLTSLLTSKLPTSTRVVFPPDILRGAAAYQHLPGILRRLGYETAQLTVPHYGDAASLNLREGFDTINGSAAGAGRATGLGGRLGDGDVPYFIGLILQRISGRLLHIAGVADLANPLADLERPRMSDRQRLDALVSLLRNRKRPVFAHVHLANTHGPRFRFTRQVFTAGQKRQRQKGNWNEDYYDDAILSFDEHLGELFDFLERSRERERTVVVLYSDHGSHWQPMGRVPLLFWFPRGQHAGSIAQNAQNLDIAPTLLDHLQVAPPPWVEGRSLLRLSPSNPPEPLFFAGTSGDIVVQKAGRVAVDEGRARPPFYQIAYLGFYLCDRWYRLDVLKPALDHGPVAGHTAPCAPESLPGPEDAAGILLGHAAAKGYDVAAFPAPVPVSGAR